MDDLSPALRILKSVYDVIAKVRSGRRRDMAMFKAVEIAIESGAKFHPDDFTNKLGTESWSRGVRLWPFQPQYWSDIEHCYSIACGYRWGRVVPANPSAVRAIEKRLGRKPFLVCRSSGDARLERICVGKRFAWHVDMKRSIYVKATSFRVHPDGVPYVVAVRSKQVKQASQERQDAELKPRRIIVRPDDGKKPPQVVESGRLFRITHEDLARYNDAVRSFVNQQDRSQQGQGDA